MRSDQLIGLSAEADEFLAANELVPEPCPHCKRGYGPTTEPTGLKYSGMFGQEYDLFNHKLKSERFAEEYLQASPWSSGPMFFLGLKVYDFDGTEIRDFKWTEEEIQKQL